MLSKYVVAALAMALLASCSSRAKNIETSPVSASLTCEQLRERAKAVSSRAMAANGGQEPMTDAEAAWTKIGRTVFWIEIQLFEGNDASSRDVARLKAEMMAIERASEAKNCGIEFRQESLAPKKAS